MSETPHQRRRGDGTLDVAMRKASRANLGMLRLWRRSTEGERQENMVLSGGTLSWRYK